jgi:hypothetical protein
MIKFKKEIMDNKEITTTNKIKIKKIDENNQLFQGESVEIIKHDNPINKIKLSNSPNTPISPNNLLTNHQ